MDRPTKGYKAVIRYNEFRWVVLEMDIPDDATLSSLEAVSTVQTR